MITLLDDQEQEVDQEQVGCGETAVFSGLTSGTYNAEEETLSGNFSEISNDCDSLVIVEGQQSDSCEIVNEEGGEGTILIVKDTNPETTGPTFDFDGDLGDIDLADDDFETFSGLTPGDYDVTENEPPGWNLVAINCTGGDADISLGSETATIHLEAGETISCTFVNEPQDGTIIIEKDVNPEPDGTNFSFSDDIPGCSIGSLDDDANATLPNSVTCNNVTPGSYEVTENNPSPYTLVNIDCDDNNSSTSVASRTAFIDLEPGETVRCVFTNVPPEDEGTITIVKDTNPETSGISFDFDGDLGDIDLEDDGSQTFMSLGAGDYTVTENEPSGWNLVDINCDSTDVSFSGNSVTIHLGDGEDVTCTFVNQPLATLTPTPTKTPIVIPAATATKTPVATIAPVQPPSAGDGGLLSQGNGLPWFFGMLGVVAAAGTAWLFLQRQVRRSRRG